MLDDLIKGVNSPQAIIYHLYKGSYGWYFALDEPKVHGTDAEN